MPNKRAVKFCGKFNGLHAVEFSKGKLETIGALTIPKGSNSAFFYPKYHFGDFRYCWGMPITFWDTGSLFLKDLLTDIYFKFRAGSTISIYFTVGLAIPLAGEGNRCIRIEKEYGHGTSIAEAQNDFKELRKVFKFFKQQRTTKESINWALDNILNFGHWDNNTLIPYWDDGDFISCKWYDRNFSKREVEFISNKLNNDYYCKDMTQLYYYSSDAYELKTYVEDGDARNGVLKI